MSGYLRNRNRGPARADGFTLVELMAVLVIVAVLLSIAVPSFSILSLRTKLKAYSNDLVSSAYLARGEAVKRNIPVTLCIANADGDACVGAGDWDQGWIVIDPAGDVKKWQQSTEVGIKIFELSSIHTITFQPSGIVNTPVTMRICQDSPSDGFEERVLTISTTMRHSVDTTTSGCNP
jgi:type IV fimbrial biogenesis protein FimT